MHVRAVIYHPHEFSDQLYHEALSCLDPESQTRIQKFYHREDACRSLIGQLLIRKVLKEDQGLQPSEIKISKTSNGKPFLKIAKNYPNPRDPPQTSSQQPTPPIAYNITHDNSLIALVSGQGYYTNPPAFSLGIDVMKVQVPGKGKRNVSIDSFIEVFQDQLTPTERTTLLNSAKFTAIERTESFFQIWTIKEAYTKALGLGLGFDFKRIQVVFSPSTTMTAPTAAVNPPNGNSKEQLPIQHILIDGAPPQEWSFHIFTIPDGEDRYVGVTAEQQLQSSESSSKDMDSDRSSHTQVVSMLPPEQLTVQDAVSFVQDAISVLRS